MLYLSKSFRTTDLQHVLKRHSIPIDDTVLSCNQITESPDPKMASASGFELYLTKYEVSMLSRLKYKCPWQKRDRQQEKQKDNWRDGTDGWLMNRQADKTVKFSIPISTQEHKLRIFYHSI